jgi:hypothetical protein
MGAPPRRVRIPDEVADLIRRMHPELKRKVRDSLKIIDYHD